MATKAKTKALTLAQVLESLETIGGCSQRPEDVAIRKLIRDRPVAELDSIALAIENMATGSTAGLLLTRLAQDEAAERKSARIEARPIPAAPFLEALTRRNQTMTSIKSERESALPKSGGGRSSKATGVTFTHDGKPVSATQNKLSSVAWFYTNGLGAGGGRMKVGELKSLLKNQGVDDPHKPDWSLKLPNGITIGCVASGTAIPPVEKTAKMATAPKPKASTSKGPAKVPAAKTAAATKTAATSRAAKVKKQTAAKRSNVTSIEKAPSKRTRGTGATAAPTKLAPRNARTTKTAKKS